MPSEQEATELLPETETGVVPKIPFWLRATLDDLARLDFEEPIASATSADCRELSQLFRAAQGTPTENGDPPDKPVARVFSMLAAITEMMFKPYERHEPSGALFQLSDRRSAIPSDFRGPPQAVIACMAEHATHPALKARLADLSWLLDPRKGELGLAAAEAYVEIVRRADRGTLTFSYGKRGDALDYDTPHLLRRAMQIGLAVGRDKPVVQRAREAITELRIRAIKERLPLPASWLSNLDLDFGVSDPGAVGKGIEELIASVIGSYDPHGLVELWRLAARAYHLAKMEDDKNRCRSAAAEQMVFMAENQPLAMMASSLLSDAIAEMHGVPGQKERRKELRHRLIDMQAGI